MTDTTRAVIARLFADNDRPAVEAMLDEQCGHNLPLTDLWHAQQFERLWLAVLKTSGGDLATLRAAITLAQRDWRDVLVGAGFGNSLEAHAQWARQLTA